MSPRLILASGSPRRRELLGALGVAFTVRAVDLDETPRLGEEPRAYVLRLAKEKAAARAGPGELVLAADTTVVVDGEILGKPENPEDARRMLRSLSNRDHTVLTGIALEEPGRGSVSDVVETRVRVAPLTAEEIDWYVGTGEPMDKAGAYAIQGLGSLFVEAVDGNYSNVVGLPVPAVYRLFARLGYNLRDFREGT
ncbi:MAG TPA: Maf family protein [Thermoanaerobaculia bacterium]|nr:Maf family protein [Thermoanaerobaculia bacterium]